MSSVVEQRESRAKPASDKAEAKQPHDNQHPGSAERILSAAQSQCGAGQKTSREQNARKAQGMWKQMSAAQAVGEWRVQAEADGRGVRRG